jgi:DNA-binding transcriptional MerR regulator
MTPPPSTSYRGPQVCKIVGITYRQLDYWARTNLVRPSVQDAAGSGTQREYSYRDLVELKIIKNLLDSGVSLQAARTAIEYLRTHLGEELASANLVLQGSRSLLAYSGDQIVDLLREGQGVLNIVALGPVVEELDASIVAMTPRPHDDAAVDTGIAAAQ